MPGRAQIVCSTPSMQTHPDSRPTSAWFFSSSRPRSARRADVQEQVPPAQVWPGEHAWSHRAAVLAARARVHALPRAVRQAGAAGAPARDAGRAAHADVLAGAAVRLARLRVHAAGVARGLPRTAGRLAAPRVGHQGAGAGRGVQAPQCCGSDPRSTQAPSQSVSVAPHVAPPSAAPPAAVPPAAVPPSGAPPPAAITPARSVCQHAVSARGPRGSRALPSASNAAAPRLPARAPSRAHLDRRARTARRMLAEGGDDAPPRSTARARAPRTLPSACPRGSRRATRPSSRR